MNKLLAIVFATVAVAIVLLGGASAQPGRTPTATPLLHKALVSNEVYRKVFRAGPQSPVVGGFKLAPPGPSKYVCTATSCSCSGAFDCVSMIAADKKCADGSVGCSDSGCICTPK